MSNKNGFTLIELLIVILIIGILAAILIVAVIGRIGPAKINTTYQRIALIEQGLERFITRFPQRNQSVIYEGTSGTGLPRQEEFTGVSVNGVDVAQMTGGEFLRLILFPSDQEIEDYLKQFGITEAVMTYQEIKEMLNEREVTDKNDRKISANAAFIDTWGKPFNYKFPGMNHSDKGFDRKNHLNINDEPGRNHITGKPVPDIWSNGPNGVSDDGNWATEKNDPYGETTDNDDVCNWFRPRS